MLRFTLLLFRCSLLWVSASHWNTTFSSGNRRVDPAMLGGASVTGSIALLALRKFEPTLVRLQPLKDLKQASFPFSGVDSIWINCT